MQIKWNICHHHTHLFHTLTLSPEAERMAMLSELKASVLTSVRWPLSVRREVLLPVGFFSVVFRVYVSTVLFCSRRASFISPLETRRQSIDLKMKKHYHQYLTPRNAHKRTMLACRRTLWPDLGWCLYVCQLLDLITQLPLHYRFRSILLSFSRPAKHNSSSKYQKSLE